jgi:hypothetical protein
MAESRRTLEVVEPTGLAVRRPVALARQDRILVGQDRKGTGLEYNVGLAWLPEEP